MSLKQWLDAPDGLKAYAPTVYAMLSSVGWNPEDADAVEETICSHYESLTDKPESLWTMSRRIRLENSWDGEEYLGLVLSITVGEVNAENLPMAYVDAVYAAQRADSTMREGHQ